MCATVSSSRAGGVVLQGTCGWSDPTLLQCGRFYPSSAKTTEDRLRHYALHMPCVEVDTSHYAIPADDTVARWVKATPTGFTFHFKIFQLFSSMSAPFGALPRAVREHLDLRDQNQLVRYAEVPTELRAQIWQRINQQLRAVHSAGKLGVVMFQFQNGYKPTKDNMEYLRHTRSMLDADFRMAIEFRDRAWTSPEHLDTTVALLADLSVTIVAVDELEHELYNRDTLSEPRVMPINLYLPHEHFFYVRVHRREGTKRLLSDEQIAQWAQRLRGLRDKLSGPIYFMWGTDHEDQPIKNMANLARALEGQALDWRKEVTGRKGALGAMFAAVSAQHARDGAVSAGDGDGDASDAAPAAPAAPMSSPPSTKHAAPAPAQSPSPAKRAKPATPAPAPGAGIERFFVKRA